MSMTTIADLIQNPMFLEYFQRDMLERSNLLQSGIAATDPVIAARAAAAGVSGKTVDMPFFNSLDGASDDAGGQERIEKFRKGGQHRDFHSSHNPSMRRIVTVRV